MSNPLGYTSIEIAAQQLQLSPATIVRWITTDVLLSRQTPNQAPEVVTDSILAFLEERKKLPIIDPVATDVLKVAIVEDDHDLTKLLEMTIHSFDFKTQILAVGNGFSGLALLSEYKPDVLIADLNMPVMDGFRMLKAIDGTELSPKKILVTTALSPEDVRERGGIPAQAKLIGKPFALSELESLLRP